MPDNDFETTSSASRQARGDGITMAAIAELAGVSVPTVSKVLNARSDVSKRTRERVERVIREHGYVRNTAARALRSGSSGLIDLVVHDLESPYHLEIIRGVEAALNQHGFGLVLSTLHGSARPTHEWVEHVKSRSSEGVILVLTSGRRSQIAELRQYGIPLVVLDSWGQTDDDVPSVGATNWAGGFAATEHLLSLGHQRIAFIGGPAPLLSSQARLAGYRAALERAGLQPEPSLVRPGDFLPDEGVRQTEELLALADPPTAIFAGSDLQALGAFRALRDRGLAVPEGMSVVGFDDLPAASLASPQLTTVRQPLVDMGRMAAEMIVRLANSEELASERIELATTLVVRDSTSPPGA